MKFEEKGVTVKGHKTDPGLCRRRPVRENVKDQEDNFMRDIYTFDLHTHTYASGHAYNTMNEMALAAKEKGLKLLGITDHAPAMPGSMGLLYFLNLKVARREKYGLPLMLGTEVNVVDYEGKMDLPDTVLREMDVVIASLHVRCIQPGTVEQNTNAYLGAIKNPNVDIIGHPDDIRYEIDYEKLVKAARDHGTLIELNNSSLSPKSFRKNARETDIKIMNLCKKYGVSVVVGSDAHTEEDILNFEYADDVLQEVDFPMELIANTSVEKLQELLAKRKNLCDKATPLG